MRDDVDELYLGISSTCSRRREGFPRSAMEAAASGLPIIATDIHGCRQVVERGVTGRLVPLRSAASLTAALTELLADPQRRAGMSAAAAQRAAVEFDQQRQIDTTLTTYDRLLSAVGGPLPRRG